MCKIIYDIIIAQLAYSWLNMKVLSSNPFNFLFHSLVDCCWIFGGRFKEQRNAVGIVPKMGENFKNVVTRLWVPSEDGEMQKKCKTQEKSPTII